MIRLGNSRQRNVRLHVTSFVQQTLLLALAMLLLSRSAMATEANLHASMKTLQQGAVQQKAMQQKAAQAESAQIEQFSIGFEGQYQVSRWTPLRVKLAAGGKSRSGWLEVTVLDASGTFVCYRASEPISLAAHESRWEEVYLNLGRTQTDLAITWQSEEGPLASRTWRSGSYPAASPVEVRLIVTAGPQIGLTSAAALLNSSWQRDSIRPVRITEASQLPKQWYGYDAIDLLVLPSSDGSLIYDLSTEQRQAITEWISLGGKVLLTVGSQGERLFAPEGIFHDLCPGQFQSVIRQRNLAGLTAYCGSSAPIEIPRKAGQPGTVPMTHLSQVTGQVLAAQGATEDSQPLVVRGVYGLGVVTVVTFDLDLPPLANWQGRPSLVSQLLTSDQNQQEPTEQESSGQLSHLGFEDLSGQLHSAMQQFHEVRSLSFLSVALVIGLYIVIIGVGDFFFVRWRRQRALTWLTFPLMVAVAIIAIRWGGGTYQASEVVERQLDLIDIDLEQQIIRGTSLGTRYAPKGHTYDLALPETRLAISSQESRGLLLAAHGLVGTGFGGSQTNAPLAKTTPVYQVQLGPHGEGDVARMEGVPLRVGGVRAWIARSWESCPPLQAGSLTRSSAGQLRGSIRNPLEVELRDCYVAFDRWRYPLGDLVSGAVVELDAESDFSMLQWHLNRSEIIEFRDASTPWDPASGDMARLVEMLFFHEAAGGQAYTNLLHDDLDYLDLSGHLPLGKAILVGRVAGPLVEPAVQQGGHDRPIGKKESYVRLVYPVRLGTTESRP